jgi:LysM repeat protein
MAATIIAKNPEKYGFNLNYHEPLQYDEVVIDRPTDLRLIAKTAGVTYEEVKELNPELKQSVTPLGYDDYRLKLPVGAKTAFEERFAQIPEWEKTVWLKHVVRRGETLASIARKFGTTVATLRDINHLKRSSVRIGATILVPTGNRDATVERAPTAVTNAALTIENRWRGGQAAAVSRQAQRHPLEHLETLQHHRGSDPEVERAGDDQQHPGRPSSDLVRQRRAVVSRPTTDTPAGFSNGSKARDPGGYGFWEGAWGLAASADGACAWGCAPSRPGGVPPRATILGMASLLQGDDGYSAASLL